MGHHQWPRCSCQQVLPVNLTVMDLLVSRGRMPRWKFCPNGCFVSRDPLFWTVDTRGRRNLLSYAQKYADSRMNLEGLGHIYNNKYICKGFAKKHVCMG